MTYKITMSSGGGTIRCFMGGFETEAEAIEIASLYNWHWCDENGFDWDLDVEEE